MAARRGAGGSRRFSSSSAARGFSLMELVIVLVVIGVLLMIAVPAYTDQMRRSARAEMQSFVTTAASRQTQFLVDRRRYAPSLDALGIAVPAGLASKYLVAIAAADGPPPTYAIVATAVGAQVYDKCPTLALDNAGNRTPAECW